MSRGPKLNLRNDPQLLEALNTLSKALSRLDFDGIQWDSFKLEVMMAPLAEPFTDSRNGFVFPKGCTPLQIVCAINDSATLYALWEVLLKEVENKRADLNFDYRTDYTLPTFISTLRLTASIGASHAKKFVDQITTDEAVTLRVEYLNFVERAVNRMFGYIKEISSPEYGKALGMEILPGIEQKPLPRSLENMAEVYSKLQGQIPRHVLREVYTGNNGKKVFDLNMSFLEKTEAFYIMRTDIKVPTISFYSDLHHLVDRKGLSESLNEGAVANIKWISGECKRKYDLTKQLIERYRAEWAAENNISAFKIDIFRTDTLFNRYMFTEDFEKGQQGLLLFAMLRGGNPREFKDCRIFLLPLQNPFYDSQTGFKFEAGIRPFEIAFALNDVETLREMFNTLNSDEQEYMITELGSHLNLQLREKICAEVTTAIQCMSQSLLATTREEIGSAYANGQKRIPGHILHMAFGQGNFHDLMHSLSTRPEHYFLLHNKDSVVVAGEVAASDSLDELNGLIRNDIISIEFCWRKKIQCMEELIPLYRRPSDALARDTTNFSSRLFNSSMSPGHQLGGVPLSQRHSGKIC